MEKIGAVNIYVCPTCGKGISTIVLSVGTVTPNPPCVNCRAGFMDSLEYQVIPALVSTGGIMLTITHAFYRPLELTQETEDWLLNGGLLLDELGKTAPIRPDPTRLGMSKREFIDLIPLMWGIEVVPDFQTRSIKRKAKPETKHEQRETEQGNNS